MSVSPSAPVALQFSNMERAGFSDPQDEICSRSPCQEAISQHGGQQNSPAELTSQAQKIGWAHSRLHVLCKRMKHYYLNRVCFKLSCLFKLLLINMPLVSCCSNTNKASLRGKKTVWKMG